MDTGPNSLPAQLTSLIGREREMVEIQHMLSGTRLLTLTGSGGTGKTRLALQLAAEVINSFTDGVWLIELAPLSNPALVPLAVASVVGVQAEQDRPLMVTLLAWLRDKKLLLILDNCEHLVEACAEFSDAALHASRATRILATSRERLGIAGETAYRVPSLGCPTPAQANPMSIAQLESYAAVRLFVDRATQSFATFSLTSENAPAVAQICYQLDGIPLAIELAAVRVRAMHPEQIVARLDDRFRLLTSGNRTALPRQQTLRALIDWSYDLLSEPERVLLRGLSVFVGGWTLEAAEAVCAGEGFATDEVLDLLTHLVDKSLVMLDEQASAPHYRMLETIRQYAREKLIDAHEIDRLRDRHLDFFLRLAERAEPMLMSAQLTEWMPRLEAEHGNLDAALEWACERDPETARWLAGLLRLFWSLGDHLSEGQAWYVRVLRSGEPLAQTKGTALALLGAAMVIPFFSTVEAQHQVEQSVAIWHTLDDPVRLADALYGLAYRLSGLGHAADACALIEVNETVIRRFGRPRTLAYALSVWGRSLAAAGRDSAAAKALLQESLDIGRRQKDATSLGFAYQSLASVSLQAEDYESARRYHLEALACARQLGTRWLIALRLGFVAQVADLQRDYAASRSLYAEALAAYRAIGHQLQCARLLVHMSYLAVHEGAAEQAAPLLAESLEINRERAFQFGLVQCVASYAELRRAQGLVELAVRLLAAPALLPLHQRTVDPNDHIEYQRSVDAARAQLGAAAFDSAWAAGSTMTLTQALAEAEQATLKAQPVPAPAVPAAIYPAGLTAREVEVLRLVASGLTNAQVAEHLVISPRTVNSHLYSIYNKLDVTTRTAAARYALEHKLI